MLIFLLKYRLKSAVSPLYLRVSICVCLFPIIAARLIQFSMDSATLKKPMLLWMWPARWCTGIALNDSLEGETEEVFETKKRFPEPTSRCVR